MEKNTPDLILLDVLMPEQDVFETYKKLRELEKREERNQTPVIFLTGDEDSETEKKGFEIGASDFIRKPFNRESLLWRIHNVISKNKKIETLTKEATVDRLTGFLNKAAATEKMTDKDIFDADVDDSDKVLADYSLMSRIYADIKTAAGEMDCDRLEEILADMESYAIPEAEAERFLKIRKCIDNFDYEGVLSALE